MGHAILERVLLFGTRSADYIRASGHSGCIATEVILQAKQAEYMTAPERFAEKSDSPLHRGRRPYMTHLRHRPARNPAAQQSPVCYAFARKHGRHRAVKRREFITLIGGAAAAWPLAARAQVSSRLPLVAWLSGGARPASLGFVDAFLQGMRELGYIESRSFDVVYRYADGYAERLPTLAQELVQLKPNVILAAATGQAVAAKSATSTIPIVTPALADAVHLGLVASEARPGGNVTGITPYVAGLPAKQLELAREIVPRARRIGG